jgi:hypothetical protein
MTAKVFSLCSVFALLALNLQAQPVSETEARQQALSFLQQHGKSPASALRTSAALRGRRVAHADDYSSYYVFNVGNNQGFVIVSGDSRTTAILGYADSGSLSADELPDGLRFMLDCYAEEVEMLAAYDDDGSQQAAAPAAPRHSAMSTTRHAIAPMVATRWDQGTPYNAYCPTIGDELCVTGCVATAMAQAMYYYQWPEEQTSAIPAYTTRTNKISIGKLLPTKFSWSDMTTTYGNSYSGSAAETAVAKLMQYCGAALQMDYGVSGSSAYNASIAGVLKEYFGYNASYAQRPFYSYVDWVNLIYSELAAGRPVILGGQSAGGGHSFVCDGYDTDDYFHINWGWGGYSDGFFRLSALTPLEQGIGGSSTLDGFSFSQDAVIGISPRSSGDEAAHALALECLQFDATGTTATQTVSLSASGDAFTGMSLYVSLCNYLFGSASYNSPVSFDYAVVLTAADGSVVSEPLYSATGDGMVFNSNKNLTLKNLASPSGLADGTYYIDVRSRLNGRTQWQPCYDSQVLRIEATVSGNSMTLRAPVVRGTATVPTLESLTVEGNQTKGYEQTVIASVTGAASDYHGNLVLRVDGKTVMGKTVEIPAGETVDVTFGYTPTTAGNNVLALYTAKSGGTQIGTKTIAIAESDATNNLDLGFTATIDNQTDGQLYGNALRATVTVSNPSTTNVYVGQLNCSARQWTKSGDSWSWQSLGVTHYPLIVEKQGTTVVAVAADDLPSEGYYSFRITYQRVVDNSSNVADALHLGLVTDGEVEHGSFTMTDGYRLGDATGAVTIHQPANIINAGAACFADLRGLSSLAGVSVKRSSNPNCLYLLPEGGAVPTGLAGCNVVRGTSATSLKLTDGYDFYSPIDFQAATASYTRTFTQAATGTEGWSTLMLPFAPTKVTVNGSPVERTWFRSDSDEEGSFWLRSFTADAEGLVTFDHTQQMEANTPYIIAVPGDTWGDVWQMTGRPVTFSTTNAAIAATTDHSVAGNHYKFCGTTAATAVTAAYVLNESGSGFVHVTAKTTVPAFRGWFLPVSISSLTLPSLAIGSPGTTAMTPAVPDAAKSSGWFTLSGQRLGSAPAAPGLYIHNGKKVIIKNHQ